MYKLLIVLVVVVCLVGCVGGGGATQVPAFPKLCLEPAQQPIDILPNPCFFGLSTFDFAGHSQSVPIGYTPKFLPGGAGEVGTDVWVSGREVVVDLTYFGGYVGLKMDSVVLQAGQSYLLVVKGYSNINVTEWQLLASTFAGTGWVSGENLSVQLTEQDVSVASVGWYGEPYREIIGPKTFIWAIMAPVEQEVSIDFGIKATWSIGEHGSTFTFYSVTLVPTDDPGYLDSIQIIPPGQ